jgi:hypothetical protein
MGPMITGIFARFLGDGTRLFPDTYSRCVEEVIFDPHPPISVAVGGFKEQGLRVNHHFGSALYGVALVKKL